MDRSAAPILTADDFHRAKGWLEEAETLMPDIFKAGGVGADAKAMEEIYHFALMAGKTVSEPKLVKFAAGLVPAHSVVRVLENMMKAGMLEYLSINKHTGNREWRAIVETPED